MRATDPRHPPAAASTRLPVGLFQADAAGLFTHVSPGWTRITGVAASAALGEGWLDGLSQSDRPQVEAAWRAALHARSSVALDLRILAANGSIRAVRLTAEPSPDGGWVGAAEDVTDVRLALAELDLERAAARELIGALEDGVAIIGPGGIVLDASDRLCATLQLPKERVVGAAPPYPWEPHDPSAMPWRRRRGEAQPDLAAVEEAEFQRSDGSRFPVALNRVPLASRDAHVLTVKDITERKATERALRSAEESFRNAFDHAPIGMAIVALGTVRRGTILQVNRALAAMMGTTEDRLRGSLLADLLDPEAARERRMVEALLEAADPEGRASGPALEGATAEWIAISVSVPGDPSTATSAIAQVEDVTARRGVEQHLTKLAMHDPLTGLANRTQFAESLGRALERHAHGGGAPGLLYIDLDGFKRVNDRHGHAIGDQLLRGVADRLRAIVRPSDTVARLGGDEFTVLCYELAGEMEARGIAERVAAGLTEPFDFSGTIVTVGASIGIAIARPGDTPEALLHGADEAMYRVKRNGSGIAVAPATG